ncbi:MAG: metal-dependent hydrolase [Chloroflexi bacterium]|nr:metal-dependent hydrolase [Chloroflexota bacterium]
MSVKVTYHGHACFVIEGGGARLLLDPFLSGNPRADVGPDEVDADYILVSHAHGDHLGDTVGIARRTGATVIANAEIARYCSAQGLNAHAMHIGGGYGFPFGRVALTIAHHGSSFPDGSYGGNPAGFLITMEGQTIYFAGDTGLTYDMKLVGDKGIDLAILPIGDNYTMGPDDALRAVELLRPRLVVPIHYDAFPVIRQDPQAFLARVAAETGVGGQVLKPGDSLTLA